MKTAARLELEKAYKALVRWEQTTDYERTLQAALRCVAAWEGVSDEVTGMCETKLLNLEAVK
jgi:hypothetical protein